MSDDLKQVVKAWLDGETIEFRKKDDTWLDNPAYDGTGRIIFSQFLEYRIKPRTIRIGEYDVPEPCRVKPEHGTDYFVPDFDLPQHPDEYMWNGNDWDIERLEQGRVHMTREAAIIHAKALISLTGGKND